MGARFASSARRHRIGQSHARYVINTGSPVVISTESEVNRMTEKEKYTFGPDVDLDREVILDKDGRRITEARAEQIVKEVIEAVFGRPSLTAPGRHSPEIKARVPIQLKKKLQREAKRRGETSSAVIRQALEEFLKGA
jgi:hypothetical protein